MQIDRKAFTKYLCALLIFGSNGVMAAHIGLSSPEIIFLRTLIGSVCIVILYLLTGGKFHVRENRSDTCYIAISGMLQAASWVCLYEGYRNVGVGVSSLIYYCGPILLIASAPVLFNEKVSRTKMICFGIVLLGLVLINYSALMSGTGNTWGLAASVLSALTFFLMLVFNKRSRNIHGMENAVIQVTASFVSMAVFIGMTQQFAVHPAAGDWPWLIVSGVFNTAIGCYLYYSSITSLPAQTIAVCGYIEPLSAVVMAAAFLNETLGPVQILGGACIIGGAVLAETTGNRGK